MKASLLSFLWKKKKSYLMEWPQIGKFLGYTANTLINGSLFGIGGALMLDYLVEAQAYSQQHMMVLYSFFLGGLVLLLDIFPFYKAHSFEFPDYYPVSDLVKLKINLSFNLFRHFIFFIVLIQVLLVLLSDYIGWFEIGYSTLIIFSSFGLNRILKNTISFKVNHANFLLIAGGTSLLISCLIYVKEGAKLWALLLSIICFMVIWIIYFQSELDKKAKPDIQSNFYFKSHFFRILAKKDVRILLGIGIAFKVIGLVVFSVGYIINEKYPPGYDYLIWLFASPLILFTYLGYNFFGINRSHLFTHVIREHSIKKLFKIYVQFYIPLLLVDGTIFFIFTTILGLLTIPNLFFYVTCTLVLFLTAFPISLLTPILKEKYFSLDIIAHGGKSISWTAMITAFAIFFLTVYAKSNWFYWIVDILMIVIAFGFFKYFPLKISSITRNFYMKYQRLL